MLPEEFLEIARVGLQRRTVISGICFPRNVGVSYNLLTVTVLLKGGTALYVEGSLQRAEMRAAACLDRVESLDGHKGGRIAMWALLVPGSQVLVRSQQSTAPHPGASVSFIYTIAIR